MSFNISKQYSLIGLGIASLGIAGFFGLQTLYLSATVAALGAYALFPEKVGNFVKNNRPLLLGGAVGFLWWGPLGMLTLGYLGHFLSEKYDQATQKAEQVLNTLNYAAEPVRVIGNAPRSLWNSFKDALNLSTEAPIDLREDGLDAANVLRFQAPTPIARIEARPSSLVENNEDFVLSGRRRYSN
ncbi:MAG: hypothetical protein HYX61_02195 [Gammaproteobacteria bacterium]|jgi:hypothetical protein|nr:hypothetical protein [Gammaproteobacteria bacterium]